MKRALEIFAGKIAADRIADRGWDATLFDTLVGASGGPKWLILSEMDQVLGGDFLSGRELPLTLLGSSIGTWRHACLSQPDPVAAIQRLQKAYLYNQHYSGIKPLAHEVSAVAEQMLAEALGKEGALHIIEHPHYRNAIVTARAKGIARGIRPASLTLGMTLATISNALSRDWLSLFFQRIVFCHRDLANLPFAEGFETTSVPLTRANVVPALKASGAIPFLMQCENSISGAPPGPFWDGGIIDYHFSLTRPETEGLVLYPHFRDRLTPGWFDKALRWRTPHRPKLDNLVLLCPSHEFLASLPYGKIPDRGDFRTMPVKERITYWEICIAESQRLAQAFYNLITDGEPLRGVKILS